MIDTHKLKRRDLYLSKMLAFQDTEPVKVVTGIRRCGKSSLLKLMVSHLKENGIADEQIVEINFESHAFKNMNSDTFYEYVKEKVVADKRMYLFFDEVQRVPSWEDAINSFRVDFNCDIYVTGSNAYMLSSEYDTYLSGRCVEIKMLPLSFREFLYFHDFEIKESQSALGGTRKQAVDKNGEHYELRELFDAYMRFGGMPGIADVGLDQEKAMMLLEGIYSTVIMRDILERENRRGQKKITDAVLLKKIVLFLADNIGSSISVSSIGNTLVNEGLLEDGKRKGTPSAHTVQAYVNALLEAYFFYDIKRFDIKGKEYLRTLGKYYIVDIGMRNYLLGFRGRDSGHALENIVYFELLRRGYDVSIGKVDNIFCAMPTSIMREVAPDYAPCLTFMCILTQRSSHLILTISGKSVKCLASGTSRNRAGACVRKFFLQRMCTIRKPLNKACPRRKWRCCLIIFLPVYMVLH